MPRINPPSARPLTRDEIAALATRWLNGVTLASLSNETQLWSTRIGRVLRSYLGDGRYADAVSARRRIAQRAGVAARLTKKGQST